MICVISCKKHYSMIKVVAIIIYCSLSIAWLMCNLKYFMSLIILGGPLKQMPRNNMTVDLVLINEFICTISPLF